MPAALTIGHHFSISAFWKAAMARGLMAYPMGGTIDGTLGDHVLLAPPFIVTSDQIGEIVDRLGSAIDDALA